MLKNKELASQFGSLEDETQEGFDLREGAKYDFKKERAPYRVTVVTYTNKKEVWIWDNNRQFLGKTTGEDWDEIEAKWSHDGIKYVCKYQMG